MPRVLNLHVRLDDPTLKTCTIWVEEGGHAISEKVSGHTVREIENFFTKHRALMPNTVPRDFSTWLVTSQEETVLIADDPAAYRDFGLQFDGK